LRIVILPSNPVKKSWGVEDAEQHPRRGRIFGGLVSKGCTVTVVEPLPFPLNPLMRMHSLFRAIDPLRALHIMLFRRRTDAVVSLFESGCLVILALRRILRFKATVVIFDVGLNEAWSTRDKIVAFVATRADCILTLSKYQAEYILRRWPSASLVQAVRQQVDSDFYRPDAEPDKSIDVLVVGDDAGRDHKTILEATSGLGASIWIRSSSIPQAMIAGRDDITLMSARLSDLDYRALYDKAKVVVIAVNETLNPSGITTLLEAMAMGSAVVVTKSRHLVDYIEDGQTCLAVPAGNSADMRQAIVTLLSDQPTRQRLGRAAREFMRSECSMEAFWDRVYGALEVSRAQRAKGKAGR
jgi:glycosyltransferase involved in cell wall biosynthesis